MKYVKKSIKKFLPDKVIYIYNVVRILPQFLKAKVKNNIKQDINVKFFDDITTVNMIINERKSLSRFGDGEFLWMSGERLDTFQEYSEEFRKDLIKSFKSNNPNLLIGIPYSIIDSSKCNIYAKIYWAIIRVSCYQRILKFADLDRIYCNASITRPYIDYRDYNFSTNNFKNLKRIWDKKDIIFVEGEKSKLGIGNDLFDNAKSIKRIICPSKNAYEKKEQIKDSIIRNISNNTLILGALGPTASIIAAEITELGYQFIDIGHIDIEYEWYLKKSILRDEIDGKYVNESGVKECSTKYDYNEEYLNSIIDKIL